MVWEKIVLVAAVAVGHLIDPEIFCERVEPRLHPRNFCIEAGQIRQEYNWSQCHKVLCISGEKSPLGLGPCQCGEKLLIALRMPEVNNFPGFFLLHSQNIAVDLPHWLKHTKKILLGCPMPPFLGKSNHKISCA
jgi:hypothetical protein